MQVNWEAFFAIGGFTLELGLLLYISARWWAKRKLKNSPPESNERLHVTPAGFVFYGLMVFALFAGITQEHLAPDTDFGRFVSSRLGRFVFMMAIAVVSAAVGTALEKMGIKFAVRKSSGNV